MKSLLITLFFLLVPAIGTAQDANPTYQKGTVLEVLETTYPIVFGTEIEFQKLSVRLEDGSSSRDVFNDYTPVKPGDTVYITEGFEPETETIGFFVREIDRTSQIVWLFLFFVLVFIAITGIKGVRSLLALSVSIASVWFILLPLLINGYNPLFIGFIISVIILGFAIFITHGLSIVSFASYAGSLIAIVLTTVLAYIAVHVSRISGLVGDESSTLSVLYGSTLDLQGLLLAAMIIGILGVLDDVAITQAAVVREFMYEKKYSPRQIFIKAMRVGQDHAAALMNTLVLAYVSVSLPLLLIINAPAQSFTGEILPFSLQFSNELFITELVRSLVGSLGLVITIPIVTVLAIILFMKYPPQEPGVSAHAHHHH